MFKTVNNLSDTLDWIHITLTEDSSKRVVLHYPDAFTDYEVEYLIDFTRTFTKEVVHSTVNPYGGRNLNGGVIYINEHYNS